MKSLLSEGRFFWHLPVKFYRYFRGGGGCYFWEVYGRVRLSEKVVKDGDKSVSTPREERQCNYSRPRSSDDLLVSWSGRGMQGVLLSRGGGYSLIWAI